MLSYRAYFLTASDHIRHVIGFKSADDAAASLEANSLLEKSEYAAVEIYEGWRLICRRVKFEQRAA
jgi:hypothetical protein